MQKRTSHWVTYHQQ